ncbi:hypothetical protein DFJ74DRAFT_258153 [Hyaloraphidium curvatum]|nr:hypothetical protein DFJ74DRAFT_258153 [Hyaloraphidium curvatum]
MAACRSSTLYPRQLLLYGSRPVPAAQPRVADLENRMQSRAVSVALRSLLDSYRAALAGGGPPPPPEKTRLYVRLHYHLCALWRSRNSHDSAVTRDAFTTTVPVSLLLGFVITIAAGSCISAWQLAMLVFILNFEVNSLMGLAALNEELATVASVYRTAQREIRVLASGRGADDGPLVRELGKHDSVLSSFLEMDGFRALFFGFPISYGLLRTFVATAVTLGIGIWTVGVFVTLESFCPVR